MAKHYKNEQLMKFLTIIGAIVGLFYLILGLTALRGQYQVYSFGFVSNVIINFIIGLVVVIITFWVAWKPNAPFPFHWFVLLILAILLVIFVDVIAGVLVLIAFLIGLIEDL